MTVRLRFSDSSPHTCLSTHPIYGYRCTLPAHRGEHDNLLYLDLDGYPVVPQGQRYLAWKDEG